MTFPTRDHRGKPSPRLDSETLDRLADYMGYFQTEHRIPGVGMAIRTGAPGTRTGKGPETPCRTCLAAVTPRAFRHSRNGEWGLYDMHGNVWEWCADWFGKFPEGDATDPQGPESGEHRVVRGGSWGNLPRGLRCGDRGRYRPGNRYLGLGFRVVRVSSSQ